MSNFTTKPPWILKLDLKPPIGVSPSDANEKGGGLWLKFMFHTNLENFVGTKAYKRVSGFSDGQKSLRSLWTAHYRSVPAVFQGYSSSDSAGFKGVPWSFREFQRRFKWVLRGFLSIPGVFQEILKGIMGFQRTSWRIYDASGDFFQGHFGSCCWCLMVFHGVSGVF